MDIRFDGLTDTMINHQRTYFVATSRPMTGLTAIFALVVGLIG